MIRTHLLLLICSVSLVRETNQVVKPAQYAIYDQLLKVSKKDVRPNIASDHSINVTIDLVLYSLEETDERDQSIAFNVWFHIEWRDPAFQWNSSDFNGMKMIEVLPTKIWIPDIYVKGVKESSVVPPVVTTACDVYSHGVIHCEFNKRFRTHCDYHIARFPYDTQSCILEFGSWKYGMSEVDIYTNSTEGNVKFFKPNNEWELISFNNRRIVKPSSRDSFVKIVYYLNIKRKPMHYVMILILPSFLTTTLALLGLFSPFSSTGERKERVSMGLTTLLAQSFLLLVVSEQMPQSSTGFPPLLGFYILFEFFLGAFGTCYTVALIHVQQKWLSGKGPPNWLYALVCLKNTGQEERKDYGFVENEGNRTEECTSTEESSSEQRKKSWKRTEERRNQSKALKSCLEKLEKVSEIINTKEKEAQVLEAWRLICQRLDHICATLLLSINCLSLFYILATHYFF